VLMDKAGEAIRIVANVAPAQSAEDELWDALVLGLREFVQKNRFPSVLLGLSGGAIRR
jgi:NAD+ synthase (glutamine-hydrolysing)